MLVHVIDGTSPDPIGDYNAIRAELELFNPALIEKPEVCHPSEYSVKKPLLTHKVRVFRLYAAVTGIVFSPRAVGN